MQHRGAYESYGEELFNNLLGYFVYIRFEPFETMAAITIGSNRCSRRLRLMVSNA